MKEWMAEFFQFLSYDNALLRDADEEDEAGPIETLQAAIVENLKLYAEKYEEEFQPFLSQFTTAVWTLLVSTGVQPKYDALVTMGIRFLTAVVSKPMHRALFEGAGTLQSICEKIVFPSIALRESDVECFEDNPIEYIRRDIEGSDSDTRRRTACDLVRGLCKNFDDEVSKICMAYIQNMLGMFQSNPAGNWRMKDTAINMVIALAVRAEVTNKGASQVNEKIPVMQFAETYLYPGLQSACATNEESILVAGSIKFLTTFRNQMPKDHVAKLLPVLANLAASSNYVVHTYAAAAIERLFSIKDGSASRYGLSDLNPILQTLLSNIFSAMERPGYPENEYLMKCAMRVVVVAKEAIAPATEHFLAKLQAVLQRICANPTNPVFNHYMFETIAALVKFVCAANPGAVAKFEAILFPPFQTVLAQGVEQFVPYCLQILAQMLELRSGAPSQAYLSLFAPTLSPMLWEVRGNVPALARLLQAYLVKYPNETVGTNPQQVQAILGIYQKCLSSKATEAYAFSILVSLITSLPLQTFQTHLTQVMHLALTRLQSSKSLKFAQAFVHFLLVLAGKFGSNVASTALDGIQAGMLLQLTQQLIVPHVDKARSTTERKDCAVGMVRILCDSATLLSTQPALWTALAAKLVAVLEVRGEKTAADDATDGNLQVLSESGYSASYSKLTYAAAVPHDAFADIADVKRHFALALKAVSASAPGARAALTQMPPAAQQAIAGYCAAAGVAL